MLEIEPALSACKAEMLSPLSSGSGDCCLYFAVSHEQAQLPAPTQGRSGCCCSGFWPSDPKGAHASLLCLILVLILVLKVRWWPVASVSLCLCHSVVSLAFEWADLR